MNEWALIVRIFAFIWPSSIASFPHLNETIPTNPFNIITKGLTKGLKLQIQWSDLDLALIYNCIRYSHFLHLKEVPPNWMSSLRPRQSNESNFWLVCLTSPPPSPLSPPLPTTPCLRGSNYIHNKGIVSVNWFEDPKMSRPYFILVNGSSKLLTSICQV